MRVPNYFSYLARNEIKRRGFPYAVEVVGDPQDVFQPGAVDHPLRAIIRFFSSYELKKACAQASAAAYVTEHTLQRRYPPGAQTFTTHYSSIDLPSSWFVPEPRRFSSPAKRLLMVGTLEVMYKGPDVLIEALRILVDWGFPLTLHIVGDGRCRPQLEARVNGLGLADLVVFHGKIPYSEVLGHLDAADLFVLPSRTEGLPRAMIEAMARGLPCIGSTAGGIPELLPPEDLVPPGEAEALAAKIKEVVGDPERLTRMSARNLYKVREFRREFLQARRLAFYQKVREQAESCSR